MRAPKPILAITAFSAQLLVQHAAHAEDGAVSPANEGAAPCTTSDGGSLWQAARAWAAALSHLVDEQSSALPAVLRATIHAPALALPAAEPEPPTMPSGNGKRACYDDAC